MPVFGKQVLQRFCEVGTYCHAMHAYCHTMHAFIFVLIHVLWQCITWLKVSSQQHH